MLKRRFYRLEETSDVTTLTKGELLYAVEQGRLCLCAWVEAKALGVELKGDKPNRPALANLFDYSGILSLNSKQSIDCINALKTTITRTVILEPELVSNWRSPSAEYPKAQTVHFSKVTPIESQPNSPFVAFASIATKRVFGQQLHDLAKEGVDAAKEKGFDNFFNALFDLDEELIIKPLEIGADQLRFDLDAVTKVFGLEVIKGAVQGQTHVSVDGIETHPIKIMISAVLASNREANARTIWNAIKRDHQSDEREIDVDSLICNMNHDEIEWFGQEDIVRILKYKTFKNYVSEQKKPPN